MQQVRFSKTVRLTKYFTSFHSAIGIYFTFPSQYLYTIDQLYVFGIPRWSSNIQATFHVDHFTNND